MLYPEWRHRQAQQVSAKRPGPRLSSHALGPASQAPGEGRTWPGPNVEARTRRRPTPSAREHRAWCLADRRPPAGAVGSA